MKFMTKQDEIVKLRRAATTSWVLLLFVFAGLTGCANKHSPPATTNALSSSPGIRHIVKQSVMGAEEDSYSLAKVHRPVERAIESSGLAWTFLRPNSFMQNVVTFMSETIRAEGAFYSASGNAKICHVDVRDIAAVAIRALTGGNHEGKAYTLTGPDALTYEEIAGEMSAALGRTITHVSLPPSDLKKGMLAGGMPEELADRMLDLERYFREDRASSISDDIKLVTGNNPRSFPDYLSEAAATGVLDVESGTR
jgi:uncharacterized protein YbjT (DUF2867 family)